MLSSLESKSQSLFLLVHLLWNLLLQNIHSNPISAPSLLLIVPLHWKHLPVVFDESGESSFSYTFIQVAFLSLDFSVKNSID